MTRRGLLRSGLGAITALCVDPRSVAPAKADLDEARLNQARRDLVEIQRRHLNDFQRMSRETHRYLSHVFLAAFAVGGIAETIKAVTDEATS